MKYKKYKNKIQYNQKKAGILNQVDFKENVTTKDRKGIA